MAQRHRAEGMNPFGFHDDAELQPAIIALGGAMQAGRLRHDGNRVLEWCLGKVAGKADRRATSTRPSSTLSRRSTLPWQS